jgi:hypothetical protein
VPELPVKVILYLVVLATTGTVSLIDLATPTVRETGDGVSVWKPAGRLNAT